MSYSDEQNDSDDFDAHIDHDEPVDGCFQCEGEATEYYGGSLLAEHSTHHGLGGFDCEYCETDEAVKRDFVTAHWHLADRRAH
jgi:hypothetical protein